jgi:hypothetical protein
MVYDDKTVEAEFVDFSGHTLDLCTVQTDKLLLLHYESATV